MFPTTDQHEWQKVKHINKHNRLKGDSNHKEKKEDGKFKKLADTEERREGRPRRVQYGKDTVIVKKKKTVNKLTVAEKTPSSLLLSRLGRCKCRNRKCFLHQDFVKESR